MSDFEKKYTELLNAVASMRKNQKDYFRCRTGQALSAAKRSEAKVDAIIMQELANAVQLQQSMFPQTVKNNY